MTQLPSQQLAWFDFKNEEEENIPPHSVIELRGDYEIDGITTSILKAGKAAEGGSGVYAITGSATTASGGFGRCTRSDFAFLSYSDSDINIGNQLSVIVGEWAVKATADVDEEEDEDGTVAFIAAGDDYDNSGKLRVIRLSAGDAASCDETVECRKILCGALDTIAIEEDATNIVKVLGETEEGCLRRVKVSTCDDEEVGESSMTWRGEWE